MSFHSFSTGFLKQNGFILVLLVIFAFINQGCSESGDEPTRDRQETPSPAVQNTPERQDMASTPTETEQEKAMTDPKIVENLHKEVQDELTDASQAVEKAEQLLQRAPTGKGSDLALEALQEEVQSAHILLQNSQAQFNDQKFEMAKADANQAKGKADKVIQQIEQAMETVTRHTP